jgi:peptide/nickel transport system ATP-binding protein
VSADAGAGSDSETAGDAAQEDADARAPLLEVRNLEKHYPVTQGLLKREVGRVRAVDGISFIVERGETVGLVGESGCGKSTAATSILRLEDPTAGEIRFNGENIAEYGGEELRRFRRQAQMIFQNPDSSFDPRMSVGESVAEPLRIHGAADRATRREIAQDLLERVGLDAGDADRYPHEFSGGQKQRIALARALVVNPAFLVADEPVSALDVSIQSGILSLMEDIQEEFGLGMLFISHNLGVVREVCDRVAVMYLGEIVELASTEALFEDPQHPYTRALLASIPRADPRRRGRAVHLTGDVPDPADPPSGCRFHTRCPEVIQPEGYDFDQEAWRAVMDLRVRLHRRGIDSEAVETFVGGERTGAGDATLRAAIREEFDIPEELRDPDAERVLREALDHVVDGEDERAEDLLAEEFHTVCEETHPDLVSTQAGHPAACLRHVEEVPERALDAAVDVSPD